MDLVKKIIRMDKNNKNQIIIGGLVIFVIGFLIIWLIYSKNSTPDTPLAKALNLTSFILAGACILLGVMIVSLAFVKKSK